MSKIHKSEVTHGIAPLKAENGYLFENSEKAELLRQTFFTAKHLTQMKFDDKIYDNINKEVEQWSLQTGDEMHRCNDSLTWQELNHAVRTLPISNKAIDTDCIQPWSGPNFRELLLRLFNKCMEEKTWPWVTNKVIYMRKPGKSNYSSQLEKLLQFKENSLNAYWNPELEFSLNTREFSTRNKRDFEN